MTRRYPIDSSTDKPCWQYAEGSLFCNDGVSCCRDLLSTHVTDYSMSRMFSSTFTCGEIISDLLNIWWIHTISNLVPQLPLLQSPAVSLRFASITILCRPILVNVHNLVVFHVLIQVHFGTGCLKSEVRQWHPQTVVYSCFKDRSRLRRIGRPPREPWRIWTTQAPRVIPLGADIDPLGDARSWKASLY